MKLSIIIPALNEAANIERCVESAWIAGASEVIVADGGSIDATPLIAARSRAQVVESTRGRAAQQNAGASVATGEILLFLHADNWLEKGLSKQVGTAFSQRDVVCGALRQRINSPRAVYRLLERGNAERVRWLGLPYGDQALVVRKSVFDEIGGFAKVPILEDVLLMQKLRKVHWPVLLPGPVHVSPRRWERHGVIGQTLRNWSILAAFCRGVPPEQLASRYQRHEQ